MFAQIPLRSQSTSDPSDQWHYTTVPEASPGWTVPGTWRLAPGAVAQLVAAVARREPVLSVERVDEDAGPLSRLEQLELIRSSRAQKEFLAMLSHELRNPLQALSSAAALLALTCAQRTVTERMAVSIIRRQVDQVARLVDDLLDVSRVGVAKLRLHVKATRIDEVLDAAVCANQVLIDTKLLQLRFTGLPGAVWVQGDPVRLTQVFGNLLHNAAKFSLPNGVIEIGVLAVEGSGQVAVSIRDEGIGIAPDLIASVFELYVRKAQASSCDDGGLGIGLSVVRSLVELHGGRVSVRSDGLGRGSEFVVSLPATAVSEVAPPTQAC
ncbi:sensor histidine kinase [Ideonella sp. YS5]|uniref:sensor histidine kinase n=1 Tax=Ideonella sp. YS5 TaxID=3453714 RepID=UPI003EEE4D6E